MPNFLTVEKDTKPFRILILGAPGVGKTGNVILRCSCCRSFFNSRLSNWSYYMLSLALILTLISIIFAV